MEKKNSAITGRMHDSANSRARSRQTKKTSQNRVLKYQAPCRAQGYRKGDPE